MKQRIVLTAAILLLQLSVMAQSSATYLDPQSFIEARVNDALSRMTLQEKIAIIHAQSKFSSPGVARLGIPGIWCTDGPHGIRAEVKWDEWQQAGWTNDSCLAFPALTCLAATWNPEMARIYGQAIGEEALYRGKNVLLGPGVNIYRTPLNGRNFEYMGEDPYLASQMVVPYVQGVQQNGVAACVKHYALNDQEEGRHVVNVNVSDRALYEIYLPAFKAAVEEGKAWSIMGAYNRYKGQYACHNQYLLMKILRGEWGFDGAVISDWGGATDTEEAIHNGLDLEYGTWTNGLTEGASNSYDRYYLAQPYLKMIQKGEVGTEELDQKVRNVLRLIFRTSMNQNRSFGSLCSEEHAAVARRIAGEGMVLLKNNKQVLPLKPTQSILVVGENAVKMMTVGGGSSSLKAKYEISPLQGIQKRAQGNVKWVRGYVGDTDTEQDGISAQNLYDKRSAAELKREAVEAAKKADVVVFVGGLNKAGHQDCEGVDRQQYALPYGQNELIEALAAANPNIVVIAVAGNAFAMPWLEHVPAVMMAWYAGSETGHALADVLFGDVNPSGKLPFTIFPSLNDYPSHQYGASAYPGEKKEVHYKEDLFVGYRYADLFGRKMLTYKEQDTRYTINPPKHEPLFAFGHGLSYTTWGYAQPKIKGNTISFLLTNTGDVDGQEVVQLYVAPQKSSVIRPVKELKAFKKVALPSGESERLEFELSDDMFQYFDAEEHEWTVDPGKYTIMIGSSSHDIRLKIDYTVQ